MRYKLLSKQKSEIHVFALLSRIKAMQQNWIAKFSEIRLLGN